MLGQKAALVLSITLVLFFGDLLPQSVCARYGLQIGSALHWLVWLAMLTSMPVSYPLSMALDWALGCEHHSLVGKRQVPRFSPPLTAQI